MTDDVINQLLWSRTLTRVSFNLITRLEPVKQMIIIFIQRLWSVNHTLGQERYVYACAGGSVTKCFYPKMFQRKFCSMGQSFMQNYQLVWELFKKNFRRGRREVGGIHPRRRFCEELTRLWMHDVHLEFSSTLISCSCHLGCFVPSSCTWYRIFCKN